MSKSKLEVGLVKAKNQKKVTITIKSDEVIKVGDVYNSVKAILNQLGIRIIAAEDIDE